MPAVAQLREQVVPVICEIEARDLGARHHDVLDVHPLEVEDAHQHPLMPMRNHHARLGHHGTQFVMAEGTRALAFARHAEQTQHAAGQQIDRPHHGLQDLEHHLVHERRGQREAFRMERADGLWRDLAEDDEDHGEECDSDCDPRQAAHLDADQGDDRGRSRIDEVVADEDQTDQAIGVLEQALGRTCAAAAFAGKVPQPITVDAHQRGLRAGEEC